MKEKQDQLQEIFHELTLRTAEMFDKGTLSDSTILTIVDGTQNFTTEKTIILYKRLLEILETAKTEAEILDKGIALRDSLSTYQQATT